MATESRSDGEVTACESGQFMEKLALGMECLLFPKADVQTLEKVDSDRQLSASSGRSDADVQNSNSPGWHTNASKR